VCRRYHCLACGAILLVVPRGIRRRRLYSAGAIALALALWGVEGLAPGDVRARVSPWRIVGATAAMGWASLRRWAHAVRDKALFACVRASPDGARLRAIAARAATTLAAYASSSADALAISTRAFLGAAHVT
jgi:transposase